MLLHATLYFVLLAAATTLVAMLPGLIRVRIWIGLPIGLLLIAAAGIAGVVVGGNVTLDRWLAGGALLAVLATRLWDQLERLTHGASEIVNPRGSVGGVSWQSN